MIHRLPFVLALCMLVMAVAIAGNKIQKAQDMQVQVDQPINTDVSTKITPDNASPFATPPLGTYTTLSGFYDWQSNGGAAQHVQVNPANGNIHVVYMLSDDSTSIATSRRSAYAFSSNGGQTWNNFSNIRIPSRLSGYPNLTLLKGANAGLPAIANHNIVNSAVGNQCLVYIDSPEGSGAFSELNVPPTVSLSGTLQPIWPNIAGAADGSIIMAASLNTGAAPFFNVRTRTTDLTTWSSWVQYPDTNSPGGRYPTHANDNGYVGTLRNAGNAGGAWWHASSDNGATWNTPSSQNIYPISPPGRLSRQDTCRIWVGLDFVWNGNTPLMTLGEQTLATGRNNQGRILFWSQATGFVDVADSSNTPGYVYPLNRAQSNHLTMGWSTIGKTGNTLVIVFQAFQRDTSAAGFNFGDLFYCKSTNLGVTWSAPVNLTNTPNLDERYPSISRWNETGFINMTWQEDTQPGSAAFTDNAPLSRARQVFYKLPVPPVGVDEQNGTPNAFHLSQNYPNPFNPETKIDYRVGQAGLVTIKVYNTLGQEVATLLNENLNPGQYQVTFAGNNLPSGVYVYKMTAGSYVESKKMVLMK